VHQPGGHQGGHDGGAGEGDPGGDGGDPAHRRPGIARKQQAPEGLAPEQRVALGLELVGGGLQVGDLGRAGAGLAGVDDGLAAPRSSISAYVLPSAMPSKWPPM
jgi:hypothetical protein